MNEAEPPGNANLPIGADANANQEIGVPGGAPGEILRWHSRGYLPHIDIADTIQHVTFHLADSLPKAALDRIEAGVKDLPLNKRDMAKRKKIEEWVDAGQGSCVLRDPVIAAMVQNTFLLFDGQHYRLLAWVVMPNHVHVLFQPINGWTVAKIVSSWKKFTARRICEHRRIAGNANLPIGAGSNANQEIGVPSGPVWHREYWDRYIRDEIHLHQAVEYIHLNPVKARLVAKAEDWRWSSAFPGNANLLIGAASNANQEIGVPRKKS